MDITLNKAKSIRASINIPGDKSVSHRALIFGSICGGEVEISNFLKAQDCMSTLHCLRQLGVEITIEGNTVLVNGVGKYGFNVSSKHLDVGNSGTTLRILPALLSSQEFESVLKGDNSVNKRPMRRIIAPLSLMGAEIESKDGHAPILVNPSKLTAISYHLPVASAQVKSAILLAGLYAEGVTTVSEDIQSRNHTEIMLDYLGADINVSKNDNSFTCKISGKNDLVAKPIKVPGDISSAAYFMVASSILPHSEIEIKNCGINETRSGIIDVMKEANAKIELLNVLNNGESSADIVVGSSNLKSFKITEEQIPSLVDEIPILAVLATQANGVSAISGAQELRVKESDRLKAMASQLKLMGADIEEKPDGLIIKGPTVLKGAEVESFNDHRVAMSLAVAALVAEGPTTIKNAKCVDISFTDFFDLLKSISR